MKVQKRKDLDLNQSQKIYLNQKQKNLLMTCANSLSCHFVPIFKNRHIYINKAGIQPYWLCYNQNMSAHHQKSSPTLAPHTYKPDQLFHDSPDEPDRPNQEELKKIQQLCDKERLSLKAQSKPQQPLPVEMKESFIKKSHSKIKEHQQHPIEDLSSSQYHPESLPQSSSQNQESYSPSQKLDAECLRNLNFLIGKFEGQLACLETKGKKVRQLAQCLELTVEVVRSHVAKYFRSHQSPHSQSELKLQQQTIYKKTEMFDDAIKKVLKATPYACINDLREQIKAKLDLDLAKETLIRRLKNLKYHYIKFTLSKAQKNDKETIQLRKVYMEISRGISQAGYPIFFYGIVHMALDECRGSMWMKSKDNGQLDHIIYEKKVLHVPIIVSSDRIQFYKIYHGFYKHQNYLDALNCWLAKLESSSQVSSKSYRREGDRPLYLAVESNLIHNNECTVNTEIGQQLRQHSVQTLPFPSYSSSMNPAQVLFSQIKYVTRSKIKRLSIGQLSECIESVIENSIDLQDIRFAFRKVHEIAKKY